MSAVIRSNKITKAARQCAVLVCERAIADIQFICQYCIDLVPAKDLADFNAAKETLRNLYKQKKGRPRIGLGQQAFDNYMKLRERIILLAEEALKAKERRK